MNKKFIRSKLNLRHIYKCHKPTSWDPIGQGPIEIKIPTSYCGAIVGGTLEEVSVEEFNKILLQHSKGRTIKPKVCKACFRNYTREKEKRKRKDLIRKAGMQ